MATCFQLHTDLVAAYRRCDEMDTEDYDITVHHFRPEASDLEDIDASKLLEEVARLVLSTTHQTTWHDPPHFDSSRFGTVIRGTCQ